MRLHRSGIARWLPTELPKIQNLRVDLLGETERGAIAEVVRDESEQMPFTIDLITENEVLAPVYNRGLEAGRQEGCQGGEASLLRRQLEHRFGAVPSWVEEKLSKSSTDEIESLGLRLLEATSLDDLFRSR